jgi:quercetin dioxygenase-like cupin family protein
MKIAEIPFGITDWSGIAPTEHQGESGTAYWRTRNFGSIRVRMVVYSPGYKADHWCTKGHILLCLEGELHTELADGRTFILTPGVSYQVADDAEAHRSWTQTGAKLFIVD